MDKPNAEESKVDGEKPIPQILPPSGPRGLHAARERGIEPVPWEVQLREMNERKIAFSLEAEAARKSKTPFVIAAVVIVAAIVAALMFL